MSFTDPDDELANLLGPNFEFVDPVLLQEGGGRGNKSLVLKSHGGLSLEYRTTPILATGDPSNVLIEVNVTAISDCDVCASLSLGHLPLFAYTELPRFSSGKTVTLRQTAVWFLGTSRPARSSASAQGLQLLSLVIVSPSSLSSRAAPARSAVKRPITCAPTYCTRLLLRVMARSQSTTFSLNTSVRCFLPTSQ